MQKNLSMKINRTSAITYFVMVVLFASIKVLLGFGVLDGIGEIGKELLGAFIQIGIMLLLSIGVMCITLKQKPLEVLRYYGFKKISWKGVVLSVLIGIVIYILNVFLSSFFNMFLGMLGYTFPEGEGMSAYPVWLLIVNLIFTAVLPAICEETAHRGMLLNGLSSARSRSKAIILSSLMFGLLHCNITQFFYATLIGLFLGYITSVIDNIYPAMIMHFMNNALSVFMGYSRFHGLGAEYLFTYAETFVANNAILGFMFIIILCVLLAFLLKLLTKILFKTTILKQLNGLNNKVLVSMEKFDYMQDLESIKNYGETFRPNQMQDFARFKSLYYSYGKEFGFTSKIKMVVGEEQTPVKDKVATAFYVTSLIILSALTIFSFVWNVLGV
ncbi:MAG: CPBP family intramembrane metalloprotease [Clostridia bacterium]|nr:CPBP family intramembrane metalloprotease [Clostridia bacterium]